MNDHTDRTQDRTTITASRGLQGVREAAQRDKGLRFTTLLHHVNETGARPSRKSPDQRMAGLRFGLICNCQKTETQRRTSHSTTA
jgi:predicted SprT family Zn-dependent metalloprotease